MDSDFTNRLIDQFEDCIKAGEAPSIESQLDQLPEESRPEVLLELIALEVYHATKNGRTVAIADYERFGEAAANHAKRLLDDFSTDRADTNGLYSRVTGPDFAADDVIGPYTLIEKLGEGGMGTVWLAEQIEPVKRRVALKFVKSGLNSKEIIARFDAEKQALAMMNHQNIARVLDAGTSDSGRPWFVMELVDGIPITDYCDNHKLSVDERLMLFVPVCKAVQHAHQKGILHRDLKPSNVLVANVDGEAVPKVIDFGMAKAVQQDLKLTDKTMQTEFGRILGTLQYMSPEQAELDPGDIDTRTDVYSLGVVLYELLSGSTPLDKETLKNNAFLKALEIVREKEPPKPSSRLGSSSIDASSLVSEVRRISPARLQQILAGELDWVIMKALEKDRARRYQTANDFARDISNYLTGKAINARPPSTWYQLQKFTKRNRGLVTGLVAVGLALIAGIIGTSYGLIRANEKAVEAKNNLEIARIKTQEAETERLAASNSENLAISEKGKAEKNERRAVAAQKQARDSEAEAKFQLAVARFEADRAVEARSLLHKIPEEYRDNFEWHYCNRRFQGSNITCYGHTGELDYGGVYSVAFSPDGKWFASASGDKTVKIWNAVWGQEVATLASHFDGVTSVAISPDAKRIATAGHDNTIKLWDAETHEEIATLANHSATIQCVAFSPDGTRLASAGNDRTIRIWDWQTGEEVLLIAGHKKGVTSVSFSPDGSKIASASYDKTVKVWDSRTGEQIAQVGRHTSEVRSLAFSPDGSRLATTSYSRVTLYDTQSWQPVHEARKAHSRWVLCIAFSPDGTQFATGSEDSTAKLWDTKTGQPLATFSGHSKSVLGVTFSPDGSHVVSGSRDRTVRVWDVRYGNEIVLKAQGSAQQTGVRFSPDGRLIASGKSSGGISVWNTLTKEEVFTLKGHEGMVEGLSFSPDGTQLASASYDHTVRIWNTKTGEEVAVLNGHPGWVRGVAFSPDGTRIASACYGGSIKLWDSQTHEQLFEIVDPSDGYYCVTWSPDGQSIAAGSFKKTVQLWDAKSGMKIRTFKGHTERVRSVAFGPLGTRIASTGNDGTARVWSVDTGEEIAIARAGAASIFGLAYSPIGNRMATASTDNTVKLFDVDSGREIMALDVGGVVSGVNFDSDGMRLAAAGHDGTVRIWDASPVEETKNLKGHTDSVIRVSFNEDSSKIYSESRNEKLVWDFESQQSETCEELKWPEVSSQFSTDGRWFVGSESNHVVLVDNELRNVRAKSAVRSSRARFDVDWHEAKASEAYSDGNHFACDFHYQRLLEHCPDSVEFHSRLSASKRSLNASPEAVDALSSVNDVAGEFHGTFYCSERKRVVTTFNEGPFANSDRALFLDGSSFVDLGNPTFHETSFTAEGWIKPDGQVNSRTGGNSTQAILTVRATDTDTVLSALVLPDGRLRVNFRNPPGILGGIDIFSDTKINDDQWHHFAIVNDEDHKLRLYVDGHEEAVSEVSTSDFKDIGCNVVLGVNTDMGPRFYKGLMDEVRFWSIARSGEEIVRDSDKRVAPDSVGLVAAYDFEFEGRGDVDDRASGIRGAGPSTLEVSRSVTNGVEN